MRPFESKGQILILFSVQKQLIYSMSSGIDVPQKMHFLANRHFPKFILHLFLCLKVIILNIMEILVVLQVYHVSTITRAANQYSATYKDHFLVFWSLPSLL